MPHIEAPPPRPSAQVIDFQAARRSAGRDPAPNPTATPLRLFTPPRPGLLNAQELWALEAVHDFLARQGVAIPDGILQDATAGGPGRFDLKQYIKDVTGLSPIVQPLPAAQPTLVDRLFGGVL